MPVSVTHIRELLLPGLMEVAYGARHLEQWAALFPKEAALTVSLPTAIGIGIAAAVIKNPVVSRRFLPWGSE